MGRGLYSWQFRGCTSPARFGLRIVKLPTHPRVRGQFFIAGGKQTASTAVVLSPEGWLPRQRTQVQQEGLRWREPVLNESRLKDLRRMYGVWGRVVTRFMVRRRAAG